MSSTISPGTHRAVVIRQLTNNRPVTSAVIDHTGLPDIDDPVHYLIGKAEDHIKEFKKNFVEFHRADWYIDIIRVSDNTIVETKELKSNPPSKP